jgi:hypothetical protein
MKKKNELHKIKLQIELLKTVEPKMTRDFESFSNNQISDMTQDLLKGLTESYNLSEEDAQLISDAIHIVGHLGYRLHEGMSKPEVAKILEDMLYSNDKEDDTCHHPTCDRCGKNGPESHVHNEETDQTLCATCIGEAFIDDVDLDDEKEANKFIKNYKKK